ncbi:MAG: ATP-binding cassette domain-containing protein, partial [Chloroflexota bacterium]
MTVAVAAGVALGVLLPLASTLAIGELVGAVPAAITGGPDSPAARAAAVALPAVGALFVLNRALGAVRSTLAVSLGRRLDQHLRERVMVALNQPSGVAHLEDPGVRDLIERALDVSGSRWRAGVTIEPLANAAAGWLQGIGVTLILARFNVALALAWFATCSVAAQFLRSLGLFYSQTSALRRADYLRQLALNGGSAKEVRIWGLLGWLIDRYTQESMRVLLPTWEARSRGSRVHGLASLAIGAVQLAVLAAVGTAAARGEISLRDLTVYVGATLTLGVLHLPRRDALPLAYGTATLPAVLELERLTADAAVRETYGGQATDATPNNAPSQANATGRVLHVLPEEAPRQGIRFECVSFHYAGEFRHAGERMPEEGRSLGRDADPSASSELALSAAKGRAVLQDLDLFIPASRSLTIVGENGAGKTTLVKLLARFYEPTEGQILVDAVDLRRLDLEAWRERISTAFQDFAHFEFLVRETVGVGHLARVDEADAVGAALARAGTPELASSLPHGLETQLGRAWPGGVELSGGQ